MKIRVIFLSCCLLVLFNRLAYAQEAGIAIHGKIISTADQQPVSYANIRVAQKGLGTAANFNGEFVLIVPNAKDTLEISAIGFNNRLVAVADFNVQAVTTISLSQSTIALKQVSVEYRDPMKIIQKAIARIPDNYINHPHTTRGFYREFTKSNTQPLQLSEAVFDIYNFGYTSNTESLLKLVKARDEKNQRDFRGLEVGQKPRGIFNDDIVKHINQSDIFGKEGIKRHDFEVAGIVDFKGYQAYEIDFKEKPGIKEKTYRGKVFIDTKTYAFMYFDFGISPPGLTYYKFGDLAQRMLMKVMGLQIDLKADRDQISYQQIGGKWILSGAVGRSGIYIKCPPFGYDFTANMNFNYVVTSVDTTQTAPFDEKLSKNDLIENHDTNEGETFWKDYNVILADFNTETVVKNIDAINNSRRLRNAFEQKKKLPKDPAIRIDSMLAFYHANGQFNGTALIKNKGIVILSKSYGYADKEAKLPANTQTTYRIGSTSKTFTSVIINQLVNEGKLDVHLPIRTYIPYYTHGDVTIQQLLTHTSGIPEYFNSDDYKEELLTKSFTLKDAVLNFCSDSLQFKSGTGFEYSNSGFTVLALIAQEVTGKPFETLLQERIFTPLQMADTYFGLYKGSNGHQAIGYAEGIAREAKYDYGNEAGAGGISSSAEDMLKYHDALLTDKLLPKAAMDTMMKTRVEFKDYKAWYDYGWMTDKDWFAASKKNVINYHPGTDLGFFTMFVREPDTDTCIILLNNTGEFPRYDLTDMILNVLN